MAYGYLAPTSNTYTSISHSVTKRPITQHTVMEADGSVSIVPLTPGEVVVTSDGGIGIKVLNGRIVPVPHLFYDNLGTQATDQEVIWTQEHVGTFAVPAVREPSPTPQSRRRSRPISGLVHPDDEEERQARRRSRPLASFGKPENDEE